MSEITKDDLEAEYYRGMANGREMEKSRRLRSLSGMTCSTCKHYDPCNYLMSGPEGCVETCDQRVDDFSYILANDLVCNKHDR